MLTRMEHDPTCRACGRARAGQRVQPRLQRRLPAHRARGRHPAGSRGGAAPQRRAASVVVSVVECERQRGCGGRRDLAVAVTAARQLERKRHGSFAGRIRRRGRRRHVGRVPLAPAGAVRGHGGARRRGGRPGRRGTRGRRTPRRRSAPPGFRCSRPRRRAVQAGDSSSSAGTRASERSMLRSSCTWFGAAQRATSTSRNAQCNTLADTQTSKCIPDTHPSVDRRRVQGTQAFVAMPQHGDARRG